MSALARSAAAVAAVALVAACTRDRGGSPTELRVGYLRNLTHAPALLALERGTLAAALAPGTVEPLAFTAGPEEMSALFAGELDVAYVGPNPAINAFIRSRGTELRVIAGCTEGGAAFVVQPEVTKAKDLEHRKVASPQLGNSQDVALRSWLAAQGVRTEERGGTVQVVPVAPSDALTLFVARQIAGAWVPEPWASRLVVEGGGRVLVDERTLWEDGRFPTTVIVASTRALATKRGLVERFLEAHATSVRALEEDPAARADVERRLAKETGKPLAPEVFDRAFAALAFETEPPAAQLDRVARDAEALGYLREPDLRGLVEPIAPSGP